MLQVTVLASQYRTPAALEARKPEGRKGIRDIARNLCVLDLSFFKNPSFVFFSIGVFLLRTAQYGSVTVLANTFVFYGVSLEKTTLAVTLGNCVVFLSRLGCGFVANLKCTNRVMFLGAVVITGGLGHLVIAFFHTFGSLLLGNCIFGFSIGRR